MTLDLNWLPAEMKFLVDAVTEPQRVAACLYGEVRSEPVQGIAAVANVIRNRVNKGGWWGDTYSTVVMAPHQFSCWAPSGGEGNYKKLLSLMEQFAAKKEITDPGARECIGIAHLVMGNYLRDNTKGSFHYHVATMTPRPKWAMGHAPVTQCAKHVFYNDVK